MNAGPEMDRLIIEKVMQEPYKDDNVGIYAPCVLVLRDGLYVKFSPSTNDRDATEVMKKVAPIVGDFKSGDGFVHLLYGDSAGHSLGEGCDPKRTIESDEDDDIDREPWSFHLHVGLIGAGGGCPEHWNHGDRFCARGRTAAEAICRAVLLAWKKP